MMKTSRVRVLVVGGNKCGKKSLLHTFTRNQAIDPNRPSSVVFDPQVVDIEVDGKQVELLLQGTWSDAKDHVTCRHLYKDTNIVLMCFSIDNRATLDNIRQHWVNFVHSLYPNVPVVLVGNKKDLRTDPKTPQMTSSVSPEEGRVMADSISASGYVECSAMTVDEVRVVFETAARAVLENELSTNGRCGVL